MEDQRGCIRGTEKFEYLGVKIDEEDRQGSDIKNRINKGTTITAMLNGILWNRQITRKTNYNYTCATQLWNVLSVWIWNIKINNKNLCRWKWIFWGDLRDAQD